MRAICCAVLALATISAPLSAKKEERPPMPAGYDDAGPAPVDPLPKIIAKLRTTLADPYSIRDFTMCAPDKLDAYYGLGWVRARWNIKFTLNAKNSYGGYTGSTMFDATFIEGEVTDVSQFKGLDLLPREVNAKLIANAQACPRVPDADIQKLLAA